MRDVAVKAKAKLGKLPGDDLYNELIHESDLDRKIGLLKTHYSFLEDTNSKRMLNLSYLKISIKN